MTGPYIYHGVDLVEIDRIERAVARWGNRFLQRVFSPQELADAAGSPASLAARFAAKEAVAKALGGGLRGLGASGIRHEHAVGWRDIEIVRAPNGQPRLRLHGRADLRAQQLRWSSVAISLSHARTAVVASIVALADTAPDSLEDGAQGALW